VNDLLLLLAMCLITSSASWLISYGTRGKTEMFQQTLMMACMADYGREAKHNAKKMVAFPLN